MSAFTRRFAVALAALLLVAGCDPDNGPRDNRPPGHPPQPSAAAAYDVVFVVGVTGPAPDYQPAGTRDVRLVVAALQKDGQFATSVNPNTGETFKGPVTVTRRTGPAGESIRWGMTLGAGVVTGSVTATYLGTAGQRLSCHVERDGVELPASRDERRIEYTASGRGAVEVYCFHTPTDG